MADTRAKVNEERKDTAGNYQLMQSALIKGDSKAVISHFPKLAPEQVLNALLFSITKESKDHEEICKQAIEHLKESSMIQMLYKVMQQQGVKKSHLLALFFCFYKLPEYKNIHLKLADIILAFNPVATEGSLKIADKFLFNDFLKITVWDAMQLNNHSDFTLQIESKIQEYLFSPKDLPGYEQRCIGYFAQGNQQHEENKMQEAARFYSKVYFLTSAVIENFELPLHTKIISLYTADTAQADLYLVKNTDTKQEKYNFPNYKTLLEVASKMEKPEDLTFVNSYYMSMFKVPHDHELVWQISEALTKSLHKLRVCYSSSDNETQKELDNLLNQKANELMDERNRIISERKSKKMDMELVKLEILALRLQDLVYNKSKTILLGIMDFAGLVLRDYEKSKCGEKSVILEIIKIGKSAASELKKEAAKKTFLLYQAEKIILQDHFKLCNRMMKQLEQKSPEQLKALAEQKYDADVQLKSQVRFAFDNLFDKYCESRDIFLNAKRKKENLIFELASFRSRIICSRLQDQAPFVQYADESKIDFIIKTFTEYVVRFIKIENAYNELAKAGMDIRQQSTIEQEFWCDDIKAFQLQSKKLDSGFEDLAKAHYTISQKLQEDSAQFETQLDKLREMDAMHREAAQKQAEEQQRIAEVKQQKAEQQQAIDAEKQRVAIKNQQKAKREEDKATKWMREAHHKELTATVKSSMADFKQSEAEMTKRHVEHEIEEQARKARQARELEIICKQLRVVRKQKEVQIKDDIANSREQTARVYPLEVEQKHNEKRALDADDELLLRVCVSQPSLILANESTPLKQVQLFAGGSLQLPRISKHHPPVVNEKREEFIRSRRRSR